MRLQICYNRIREDQSPQAAVRIERCFGNGASAPVPSSILGMPVVELAPYCFSCERREVISGEYLELEEGEEKPIGADEVSFPTLCGESISSISLPDTIRRVGRYAFYNCDGLRKLSFTSTIQDMGAGAFTGCRHIERIEVQVIEGERSCLKEILADLTGRVRVDYRNVKTGELARLIFPAFYEEAVENTPARLLSTATHGCGHRYRYCFYDTGFLFEEYDSVFPHAKAQEKGETVIELALGRLYHPYRLSDHAKKEYGIYLQSHWEAVGDYLIGRGDFDTFKWFVRSWLEDKPPERDCEHASEVLKMNEGFRARAHEGLYNIGQSVLGKTEFDKLIQMAGRADRTSMVSFLMEEKHRLFPSRRRKFQL